MRPIAEIQRFRRGLTLGLVAASFGAIVSVVPRVLELDENVGLAALFSMREPPPVPDGVAIVGISQSTSTALQIPNELDEWPRSVHAELVERLARAGAAVIVFDIVFSEWRDPIGDTKFADAIAKAANVVLLERTVEAEPTDGNALPRSSILYQRRELPHPNFKRPSLGSGPFTLPRVPVRVSQFWIFDRGGGNVPSLPTVALQAYGSSVASRIIHEIRAVRPEALPGPAALAPTDDQGLERTIQRIRDAFDANADLGGLIGASTSSPGTDRERRLEAALLAVYTGPATGYLNYYGPAGSIKTVPYQSVMAWPVESLSELGLAGKVVFVGLSESRQSEQVDTFYSVFSERSGRNLSGVEIGATAFANLLDRELIVPVAISRQLLLLLSWGLVLGAAMMLLGTRLGGLFVVVATIVYWLGAGAVFESQHVWLPLVVPLLMQAPLVLMLGTVWNHAVDRVHKERLRDALSSYVPEAVVDQLDHRGVSRDSFRHLVRGTCLFTDVKDYTRISELRSPAELTRLMNEYYDVLYSAVKKFGGQVSDMAGDSMVAIWAGEKPDPAYSRNACAAAWCILEEIEQYNRSNPDDCLQTGIGLASGELMLSNVGSDAQFDYRAVGDVVSIAARIQSLNRRLRTRALATADAVDWTQGLCWREVGDFMLAGKTRPVKLYELLGDTEHTDADVLDCLSDFEKGLSLFRGGDWRGAERAFQAVLARKPGDGPAELLLGLSRSYVEHPSDSWDGVVRLTAK